MTQPASHHNHPPETILITGGCGFIGTNLVEYLLDRGYRIRILDNLSTGNQEYLRQLQTKAPRLGTAELTIGDIRNQDEVRQAVSGMDAVVHLAAHTSVVESLEHPAESWDINVNGTLNLLEACREHGVTGFILASSNAVVGEQPPPIDESKLPQPLSPYGASKLAGEALCSSYYRSFGLKTVAMRFANCYGRYSEHKPSVIPKLITWAQAGKPLIIYGDGEQTRDFVHASDICRAIHLTLNTTQAMIDQPPQSAIELYGSVFQIGSGVETSINQLVGLIEEIAGEKLTIDYQPERKGEIKRNFSDISKARRILGFKPGVTLKKGLKELWELSTGDTGA